MAGTGLLGELKAKSRQFVSSDGTLTQRVIHGGFWVFAIRIVSQLLAMAKIIVLGRMLSPADFGLFGVAALALSMLDTLSRTGFEPAIIQRQENPILYLDVAWTVQVGRGVLLGAIAFLSAPLAAGFFGQPAAMPLLRILALSLALSGFANSGVIYFRRDLHFHKSFVLESSSVLADFATAIAVAVIFRSAWALVAGKLAASAVTLVMSYLTHPYKPHLRLDLSKARELYAFGRWVFMSSILVFLLTEGDDVIVGRIVGVAGLGLYQMAYRLSNLPTTQLVRVVSMVTFPAFSKLQSHRRRLKTAFLRSFAATSALAIPMSAGIAILAHDLTLVLLGPRWLEIVPAMQVLAIWGAVRALGASTSPLLQAIGQPRLITLFQAAMALVLFILIVPLTKSWGVLGAATAVVVGNFAIHWFRYPIIARQIDCKAWEMYRLVLLPFAATLAMSGSLHLLKPLAGGFLESSILRICSLIAPGVLVYAGTLWVLGRVLGFDLFRHVLNPVRFGSKHPNPA